MMGDEQGQLFFEAWRACLQAHFMYVVQTKDEITEPTLREVLRDAGVPENEIDAWYDDAVRSMQQQEDA